VVVGVSTDVSETRNALLWRVGAPRPIHLDPDLVGQQPSAAIDVSGDGLVAVGNSGIGAFRWSVTTGMVPITSSVGWTMTSAAGTNSNGSVIVGNSSQGPWLWDPENGPRLLSSVLTGMGVNLTGWTLTKVEAVSRNGKVIVGGGRAPSGFGRSFVIRLL